MKVIKISLTKQQIKKAKRLQAKEYNGRYTLTSKILGIGPSFQDALRWRTNLKLATNVVVTGEPGIGKSYQAISICRCFEGFSLSATPERTTNVGRINFDKVFLNGKWDLLPRDSFSVNQIVFTHSMYMEQLMKLRMGKPIVFDEPSYAMGKRDWFKELQKALVQTLESQRFLIHPLFIPIINMSLLDKTIRNYLIQFQIHVLGRGYAKVYRIKPSQSSEKIYREEMTELYYLQPDLQYCKKDSCLGCKQLGDVDNPDPRDCPLFMAKYERKKRKTQYVRYEQAKAQAQIKESSEFTDKQLEELVWSNIDNLIGRNGRINVSKMRLYLRSKHHIHLSNWKGYNIRGILEAKHPKRFDDLYEE